MPSSQIADYELGAILGVGTVGTIYEGIESSTGQRFAIKKLHPGISSDKLIRARFQREMTILQRLQHPNIIGYYGGGEADDGLLYYIMELVEGGTVKELLEANGHLSWQVVVDVARQICSALQCAHNHGVIHRDLKPGNLFLTKSADVKLGDFGIARDLTSSDLTATGLTVGTHAYMSPEQITGDAMISGKTDLYALGCCLFEMLSGRKTFLGENFAQLFEQHLRQKPQHVRELVPECPQELDAIIDQLLEKDPEDRPFNARKVQGAMLQLGEKYDLHVERSSDGQSSDVGADAVTERGRLLLQQQIADRLRGREQPQIGWGRLVALALLIGGVILLATIFGPKG
ncbi:serine/threonine protein kinase [Novipirellula artificiosorum]|uniref:non-specific serine/threonine protein kinase n=1 Tax=Novipirellula artificiosorum TaxID=2528016 RepID=A0A5C6DEY1_9BACT|nr:serine/threonine-protein kinase [Novipirellula artificiosorum]TWU34494.1 Serine/threonine-protein kinase PknB [Novipirellula artificiosorum]